MALDLERDVLKSEISSYTNLTNESIQTSTPILNQPDTRLNSTEVSMFTPLPKSMISRSSASTFSLNHSTSVLPKPWLSLFGSMAYLRPLIFNEQGQASYAQIELPKCIESEEEGSVNLLKNIEPVLEESNIPHSLDVNDGYGFLSSSEDESEADRLLGLSLIRSNKSSGDKHRPNGFLSKNVQPSATREEVSNCAEGLMMGMMKDGLDVDNPSGDPMDYDDTYDFWQELMHEQGISMIDADPSASLLEENCFDNESMLLVGGVFLCFGKCNFIFILLLRHDLD